MRQFGTILKFELKGYFKNKIFVGITVFLVLVIAVSMFLPNIFSSIQLEKSPGADEQHPVLLIYAEDAALSSLVKQYFDKAFPDYQVKIASGSLDEIRQQIAAGQAECAFAMDSASSYTYYVNNLSMYDTNTAIADTVLLDVYRFTAMTNQGIPPEQAESILSVPIDSKTVSLGKDQMKNFFYTYLMILALYIAILLYGQMVATNVATEKSSRAMELLITSAKPTSMMFGKVLASCLAGLIQLIAVFGTALLCYQINSSAWGSNELIASLFHIPVSLFIYLLVFFTLGFLIYAFLYGAIGSTASKLEDINTSVMPITFLFLAAFMIVIFSMTSGNVDTVLMKVCSFIPFTSPIAMFTRICMSMVPWYEIMASIAILIVSTVAVGVFAAKIYRVGVLLYGTPPKIGSILKAIFRHR